MRVERSGLSKVLNGKIQGAVAAEGGRAFSVEMVLSRIFPGRGIARVLAEKLLVPEVPNLVLDGKYALLDELGKGGQGVARFAIDLRTGEPVVIKSTQAPASKLNELQLGRFDREWKILEKLGGRDAPAMVDHGITDGDDGYPYMAMEYVKGYPLDKLYAARSEPWPEDASVALTRQIAGAMGRIHRTIRGPHRDLKPANIIVQDDGRLKIIDFGLAALAEAEQTLDQRTADLIRRLTQSQDVFGTPQYMSPEQAGDASKVDERADVYSLGVMLLEMVNHCNPFAGATVQETWARHGSHVPDLLNVRNTKLAAVIAKMIAKKPEDRFRTMDEAERALAAVTRPATASVRITVPTAGDGAPIFSDHASPQSMVEALVHENGRPDLAIGQPGALRVLGKRIRSMRSRTAALFGVGVLAVSGTIIGAATLSGDRKSNDSSVTPVEPAAVDAGPKPPPKAKESMTGEYRKQGKHVMRLNIDDREGLTHLELPNGVTFNRDQIVQMYGTTSASASASEEWLGAYVELDPEQQVRLFHLVEPGEPVTANDIAKLPQNTTRTIRVRVLSAPSDGKRFTVMIVDTMGGFIIEPETVDVDGRPMQLGTSHFPSVFAKEFAPIKAALLPQKTYEEFVLRPDVQALMQRLAVAPSVRIEAGKDFNTVEFGPDKVADDFQRTVKNFFKFTEKLRKQKN